MRESICATFLLLVCLIGVESAGAQTAGSFPPLVSGVPAERTVSAGQTHNYSIVLEKDQFLRFAIDQRGIDLVVRTYSPIGNRLGEFDSPNGMNGPEYVTVVAIVPGQYRIEVAPLNPGNDPKNRPSGRFEVQNVEVRRATEQELKAGRSHELLKARGVALLLETVGALDQLRRPESRAGIQINAARLLWDIDEVNARRVMERAIDGVREFIANAGNSEQHYYQTFNTAMQLRSQVIDVLSSRDPEMALEFLRTTGGLENPEGPRGDAQSNQERQLQLTVASRIASKDPRRAFQIAEETLKGGISSSLTNTLQQIRSKEPELASKLARDIVEKLADQNWLQNPETASLAVSLVQIARPTRNPAPSPIANRQNPNLLTEAEHRGLVLKMISQALSFSVPPANAYTNERNSAQSLINALKSAAADVQSYAPEHASAIEQKWSEFRNLNVSPMQPYQTLINNSTVDAALESISQAPVEFRDQLYQQVANKVAQADPARARQIIVDRMSSPQQSQQALRNLDRQAVFNALNGGRLDEALRCVTDIRPASDRAQLLNQVVNQIGPAVKKAALIQFLEQIRNLLGPTARAEDRQQMSTLFAMGRTLSRYEPDRAFGIVEPLIDQFGDISTAALALNGFDQTYFVDGELVFDNGNSLGSLANDLGSTIGTLALTDFDRARAAADRIRLTEVRIRVYLTIAEQSIQPGRAGMGFMRWQE